MSVALTFIGLNKAHVGELTAKFNQTKGASAVAKYLVCKDEGTAPPVTKVELTVASATFRRLKGKDLCWHGQLHLLSVAFEAHPTIFVLQKGAFARANYLARMEALKAKWIKKGFWGCTCLDGPDDTKPKVKDVIPKKIEKAAVPKIEKKTKSKTTKTTKSKTTKSEIPQALAVAPVTGDTKDAYGELVELEPMIAGFYALESIVAPLMEYGSLDQLYRESRKETFFYTLPGHLRNFAAEFLPFKEGFDRQLARMLFDYLALACFGEARHANGSCSDLTTSASVVPKSLAVNFDPRQFLPICEALFKGHWSGNYGGRKWAKIADSAQWYFILPPSVFVDHVVDLSHNCNIVFDKGCIVTVKNVNRYKALLDRKREGSAFADDERPVTIPEEVARFFYRGAALDLIPFGSVEAGDAVRFYDRIQWGEQTLTLSKKHGKKGGTSHGTVAPEKAELPFEPKRVA